MITRSVTVDGGHNDITFSEDDTAGQLPILFSALPCTRILVLYCSASRKFCASLNTTLPSLEDTLLIFELLIFILCLKFQLRESLEQAWLL